MQDWKIYTKKDILLFEDSWKDYIQTSGSFNILKQAVVVIEIPNIEMDTIIKKRLIASIPTYMNDNLALILLRKRRNMLKTIQPDETMNVQFIAPKFSPVVYGFEDPVICHTVTVSFLIIKNIQFTVNKRKSTCIT